jgi:hypothetical protein
MKDRNRRRWKRNLLMFQLTREPGEKLIGRRQKAMTTITQEHEEMEDAILRKPNQIPIWKKQAVLPYRQERALEQLSLEKKRVQIR